MRSSYSFLQSFFILALSSLAASSGCSTPKTLAYQSVQEARVVDNFRLEGRIDEATFTGAAGVVVLEIGRGGLGIGITVGHGVAIRRLDDRWSPPLPVNIVAGSIGLQIGGEGGRLVMIFEDVAAFEDFVFEGTQFVAEASGTAWTASGAAGDPLDRERVKVISSMGGLYGGAVIGGFGVSVDKKMLKNAFGADITPRRVLDDRDVAIPAGASTLWKSLGE